MAYSPSDTMTHATVTLPKADVHPKHPFRNADTHEALLEYLQQRLRAGKAYRDSQLPRWVRIDKAVAGWMRHSKEDRERLADKHKNGTPQAVMMNLPLAFIHLDDMMTYFVQTFSPSRGMFYHTGKPTEAQPAQQIVTLMNNHAIYGGYYRQVVLALFSIMKYNLGGLCSYWATDQGPQLSANAQGATTVTQAKIWEGNKVESLSVYNTFWDPSVQPQDNYKDGEFCGKAKLVSHYWLQQKASQGYFYNCEQALADDNGIAVCNYYRHPPSEASMNLDTSAGTGDRGTDWVGVLSGTPEYSRQSGFELTEIYIKLNPFQMNLIPRTKENATSRNQYEIWRFTICNDKYIIDATPMNNVHGFLPHFFGVINDDDMQNASKSPAEILQPLAEFASFLLNAHVTATRKNIYGLTVYDPSMIDMNAIPEGEVAARIPLKPSGYGKDLRSMLYKEDATLGTEQTLNDLQKVMQLIDQFFPTQALPSQIAGIDRAIDSQVAAVQQGTNRRNQKDARLIDDTLFRPLRFSMYYNIIQYQQDGAQIQDFHGSTVTIDLTQLRQTDLPFIIGQGIKAIDMQAAATKLQQIIFALIQNPQAAQQVNLLGLIDYWTSLIDIDVDMTQFHIQQQAAPGQVGPDGQPIAGGPVSPITNPNAVTGALTKPAVAAPAGGAPA